jgi:hypothetical protein
VFVAKLRKITNPTFNLDIVAEKVFSDSRSHHETDVARVFEILEEKGANLARLLLSV